MHEKWPNKPWERLKLVVPTNAGFHKNFSCVSHTGIYYKLLYREKKPKATSNTRGEECATKTH